MMDEFEFVLPTLFREGRGKGWGNALERMGVLLTSQLPNL
jgi:hypothetical protein